MVGPPCKASASLVAATSSAKDVKAILHRRDVVAFIAGS